MKMHAIFEVLRRKSGGSGTRCARGDGDRGNGGGFDARELFVARRHVRPRRPHDGLGPRLAGLDGDRALTRGERERLRDTVVDAIDRTRKLDVTVDGRLRFTEAIKSLAPVQAADSRLVNVRGEVRVELASELERLLTRVLNGKNRFERAVLQRHCLRNLEILVPHRSSVIAWCELHCHRRRFVRRAHQLPIDITREPVHLNRPRAELRPAVR